LYRSVHSSHILINTACTQTQHHPAILIRTFLHRYDLYETKYWSVFDEIQGFSHHAPQAINYHQINTACTQTQHHPAILSDDN
jgi:hypothetical protein